MKKKNVFLSVALLIAVLLLGVGYAVTTTSLKVEGSATVTESGTGLNVKFTNVTADTTLYDDNNNVLASSTANIDANDSTKAVMSVTLTNVKNAQEVTFEVTNASQTGINALIKKDNVKIYKHGTTETFSSNYFSVTHNVSDIELASGNKTTFIIKVELIKAVIGADVEESFDVVLDGITAVQG